MEVLRPKELDTHPGDEIVTWARDQLSIARSILDNPGGGLLFATQTIGQVRAGRRGGCRRAPGVRHRAEIARRSGPEADLASGDDLQRGFETLRALVSAEWTRARQGHSGCAIAADRG